MPLLANTNGRFCLSHVPAKGRYMPDHVSGSPPQTSRWRWGAWKQPAATGCSRPEAHAHPLLHHRMSSNSMCPVSVVRHLPRLSDVPHDAEQIRALPSSDPEATSPEGTRARQRSLDYP